MIWSRMSLKLKKKVRRLVFIKSAQMFMNNYTRKELETGWSISSSKDMIFRSCIKSIDYNEISRIVKTRLTKHFQEENLECSLDGAFFYEFTQNLNFLTHIQKYCKYKYNLNFNIYLSVDWIFEKDWSEDTDYGYYSN